MDLEYRPLCYFWIAEFSDGTALPQFDPETGQENMADPEWLPGGLQAKDLPFLAPRAEIFKDKKLRRFGWYPFSPDLAQKIYQNNGSVVRSSKNPIYRLDLKQGDTLIAKREQEIIQFDYHVCGKCGYIWQFGIDKINPKLKIPASKEVFVENIEVTTETGKQTIGWVNAVCPNCGYHDLNEIVKEKKLIRQYSSVKRETVYALGIKGEKLLQIHEDGTSECL